MEGGDPRAVRPVFRLIGRGWEWRVEREGIPTRDFPNRPTHVCFVSEHMRTLHREAGLTFPSSEVIHGGVPVKQFHQAPGSDRLDRGPVAHPVRWADDPRPWIAHGDRSSAGS